MQIFRMSVQQCPKGPCFLVGNEECPVLAVVIGSTYTFDQSDVSNKEYPCGLFVGNDIWGECRVDSPGTPDAHFQLIVTEDTPASLMYACIVSKAIVGKVVVLDACTHVKHTFLKSASIAQLNLCGHDVPPPAPGVLQYTDGQIKWIPSTLAATYSHGQITLLDGNATCNITLPTQNQTCTRGSTVFHGTIRATSADVNDISVKSIRFGGHNIPPPEKCGALYYDTTHGFSWGQRLPAFSSCIWLWRTWDFGVPSTVRAQRSSNELRIRHVVDTDSSSRLAAPSPATAPRWTADRSGRMCALFDISSAMTYDGPGLNMGSGSCVFAVSMRANGMCSDGPGLVLCGSSDLIMINTRNGQQCTTINETHMPWPSGEGDWDVRCLTYTTDTSGVGCIVQHTHCGTSDFAAMGSCNWDSIKVGGSIGHLACLLLVRYIPSREEILQMIDELSASWNTDCNGLVASGKIALSTDITFDDARKHVAAELNVDESLVSVACIHP